MLIARGHWPVGGCQALKAGLNSMTSQTGTSHWYFIVSNTAKLETFINPFSAGRKIVVCFQPNTFGVLFSNQVRLPKIFEEKWCCSNCDTQKNSLRKV
jgi:hypothetical protein